MEIWGIWGCRLLRLSGWTWLRDVKVNQLQIFLALGLDVASDKVNRSPSQDRGLKVPSKCSFFLLMMNILQWMEKLSTKQLTKQPSNLCFEGNHQASLRGRRCGDARLNDLPGWILCILVIFCLVGLGQNMRKPEVAVFVGLENNHPSELCFQQAF